jgi:hypothetical protein
MDPVRNALPLGIFDRYKDLHGLKPTKHETRWDEDSTRRTSGET